MASPSGTGHDTAARCACGTVLVSCHGCAEPRCLTCDPYTEYERMNRCCYGIGRPVVPRHQPDLPVAVPGPASVSPAELPYRDPYSRRAPHQSADAAEKWCRDLPARYIGIPLTQEPAEEDAQP